MVKAGSRWLFALQLHASLCIHLCRGFSHIPVAQRPNIAGCRVLYANQGAEGAPRSVFIFGLGYIGLDLAKGLVHQGWQVSGTVSSQEKAQRVAQETSSLQVFAYDARMGPLADKKAREALLRATHVLVTIAPLRDERGGDGVLRWHREDLLSMSDMRWLGYLSSTGVYGDFQGAWVTEDDVPRPNTPVGEARHRAEQEWRALPSLPLHIFRLAGIYGPGRSAIDTLRKNANDLQACGVTAGDPSYISRVHVADISQAVGLSMLRPVGGGAVYNLADDRPSPRFEVFSHARGLLTGEPASDEAVTAAMVQDGGEAPPLSVSGSRRRQAGNKRVSNAKLRSELLAPAGRNLLYPDYVAGLNQIVREANGV